MKFIVLKTSTDAADLIHKLSINFKLIYPKQTYSVRLSSCMKEIKVDINSAVCTPLIFNFAFDV